MILKLKSNQKVIEVTTNSGQYYMTHNDEVEVMNQAGYVRIKRFSELKISKTIIVPFISVDSIVIEEANEPENQALPDQKST